VETAFKPNRIQQIAKEFDIHLVQGSDWKKAMALGAASVFDSGAGGTEAESFERERAQLHAKIGQQAVELALLRKLALNLLRPDPSVKDNLRGKESELRFSQRPSRPS
jgi:hypothetical protein